MVDSDSTDRPAPAALLDTLDDMAVQLSSSRAIVELVRYHHEARRYVADVARSSVKIEDVRGIPGDVDDDAVSLALYAAYNHINSAVESLRAIDAARAADGRL